MLELPGQRSLRCRFAQEREHTPDRDPVCIRALLGAELGCRRPALDLAAFGRDHATLPATVGSSQQGTMFATGWVPRRAARIGAGS
jgi:hypothetical protein